MRAGASSTRRRYQHIRAQEMVGLNICTDGDAHYDEEIGGWSWQSYPLTHMAGSSREVALTPSAVAAASPPRGAILHEQLEARVLPRIVGPLGPGNLQYGAMWKVAQRLTRKPVKFGTIMPELLAAAVRDDYYKDPIERVWAFSEAINQELNALADSGCPVIQMEEPQIHMVPARGLPFGRLEIPELVKIFNNTVNGLRGKTEVWCHTCCPCSLLGDLRVGFSGGRARLLRFFQRGFSRRKDRAGLAPDLWPIGDDPIRRRGWCGGRSTGLGRLVRQVGAQGADRQRHVYLRFRRRRDFLDPRRRVAALCHAAFSRRLWSGGILRPSNDPDRRDHANASPHRRRRSVHRRPRP
jgi:hypothetical protein